MAVTGSAPISFVGDIVAEFNSGGAAPHNLTDYYRGGTFVPDITANNTIPTSGSISLTDFYSTTNTVLPDINVSGSNFTSVYMTARGYSNPGSGSSGYNGTYFNTFRAYDSSGKPPPLIANRQLRNTSTYTTGATYNLSCQHLTQNNNAVAIGGSCSSTNGGPAYTVGTDAYNTWVTDSDQFTPTAASVQITWDVTTSNQAINVSNQMRVRAITLTLV